MRHNSTLQTRRRWLFREGLYGCNGIECVVLTRRASRVRSFEFWVVRCGTVLAMPIHLESIRVGVSRIAAVPFSGGRVRISCTKNYLPRQTTLPRAVMALRRFCPRRAVCSISPRRTIVLGADNRTMLARFILHWTATIPLEAIYSPRTRLRLRLILPPASFVLTHTELWD